MPKIKVLLPTNGWQPGQIVEVTQTDLESINVGEPRPRVEIIPDNVEAPPAAVAPEPPKGKYDDDEDGTPCTREDIHGKVSEGVWTRDAEGKLTCTPTVSTESTTVPADALNKPATTEAAPQIAGDTIATGATAPNAASNLTGMPPTQPEVETTAAQEPQAADPPAEGDTASGN